MPKCCSSYARHDNLPEALDLSYLISPEFLIWGTIQRYMMDNVTCLIIAVNTKYLATIFSDFIELLTNANVVDDAIRFVSQSSKEKLKSSSSSTNEDEKEESKEPDYDEYEDQLEEEHEEETGKMTAATMNQVF